METVKKEEKIKGVTVQHIGRIRQFTVLRADILKVHRGTADINHPRFEKDIVLIPGSIVTVTPKLAKFLIETRDFQKYGVEK